jgi:anti-sigma factor RsiW
LNPYLDGELQVSEVLVVERHLAECAVCRGQYAALEHLHEEIAAARLDYDPPQRLQEKLRPRRQSPKVRVSWRWGAGALAAAAMVLIALTIPRPDSTGREVLDGHLRSLLSAKLVDVPSSDRHTVKPWFQGKIGFSPDVPDLSQVGFVLVGGRLDVIRQQRAVALVYQRRDHVINLFIVDDGGQSGSGASESQGYHLISWADRKQSYWAVSDLNMRELEDFAAAFRHR